MNTQLNRFYFLIFFLLFFCTLIGCDFEEESEDTCKDYNCEDKTDDNDVTDDDDDNDDDNNDNDDNDNDDNDNDDDDFVIGKATLNPRNVKAASNKRFTVEYTVGLSISEGGAIRLYFGGCETYLDVCEMNEDPAKSCGYVSASSSNPGVEFEISTSYESPNVAIRLAEATIAITAGQLEPDDTVTVVYGANSGLAYAQEIAQEAEITVLINQDLSSDIIEIEKSPVLTITPLEPQKLIGAVKMSEGLLKLSLVDRYTNLSDEFSGVAEITLINQSGNETLLGTANIIEGKGEFQLPTVSSGYYVLRSVIHALFLTSVAPFIPGGQSVLFGDLHFHSKISDSYIAIDPLDSYAYAKDVTFLDFLASADHAECTVHNELFTQLLVREDVTDSWAEIQRINDLFETDGLITLLGFEVTMNRQLYPRDGHTNVYYRTNTGSIYTYSYQVPDVEWVSDLPMLWNKLNLAKIPALTIPHTTLSASAMGTDFYYYDPDFMRVVEIYSQHGCSESPDCPDTLHQPLLDPDALGSVQRAVGQLDYRLGFIAGSDSHTGHPAGTGIKAPYFPIPAGLTAVLTDTRTREAVWDAIYNRSTYATSGERIYLEFSINGNQMGSEIDYAGQVNIEARAVGTDSIIEATILKYDAPLGWRSIYQGCPGSLFWDFSFSDNAFFEDSIYYLRVRQQDGHTAWSSPIWVDAVVTGSRSDDSIEDIHKTGSVKESIDLKTIIPPTVTDLKNWGYF